VFIEAGIEDEQDNIRAYKLSNKKLYEQIDINNNEQYPGIVFEAMIPKDKLRVGSINELESNEQDNLILNSLYTQYITVVKVGVDE
jgi:hypothetical protein